MLKVLCLLMGIGCPVVAQPPIWQNIFTNRTTTGVSSNVKNSGQTQHIVYGTVGSNAPSTCTFPQQTTIRIEGSYDNSTFTAISPDNPAEIVDSNNGTFYVIGNGSYPFVRVNLLYISVTGGAASCKVTLSYTGEFPMIPAVGSVVSKAWGELVKVGTNSAAPSLDSIIKSQNAGSKFVVTFFDIITDGANNVTLQEYTDSSCTTLVSSSNITFWRYNFPAAGGTKQFPWMGSGYYKGKAGGSALCLDLSTAAYTTYLIKYRFEE